MVKVGQWCWVISVQGILLIWITAGQRPTVLAADVGECCLDIFFASIILLFFHPLSGRQLDID